MSISSVTQTTQGLSDNLQEVHARVGKLSQQMTDIQNLLQSIDSKISGGAPAGGNAPTGGERKSDESLQAQAKLREIGIVAPRTPAAHRRDNGGKSHPVVLHRIWNHKCQEFHDGRTQTPD